MVRVRFAPSPTGFLHIGGARTALFNWLYAKAQNGKFILRIEDTDRQRSEKKYEEEILQSMKWLGLDWDELYYQSKRFDLYREYAQRLVDENKAYKEGEAILLKMLPDEDIKIYDLIRDGIQFNSNDLKDQVLLKSDGSPAYSFCCVIDDALMKISHVVRGEDHISNTPKQIMIYRALGFKQPKYAHLPLIMGEDGSRLSKRTGAVAVSDYRQNGFTAEAIVNYLMLLGWSPGNNQEKVTLKAAINKFSLKKVNKAAAVFSMDKLRWLNNQYFKEMKTEDVTALLEPRLIEKGYINGNFDSQQLKSIVDLFKGRIATLNDFLDWADFAFLEKPQIPTELREKFLVGEKKKYFEILADKIELSPKFDAAGAEKAFKEIVAENNLKNSDLVHPVRVALTGKDIGPSLFEIMSILGKHATQQRLKDAYN